MLTGPPTEGFAFAWGKPWETLEEDSGLEATVREEEPMGSFERHSCYFLNPEMGPLGSCLTALLGLLGGVRQESGLKCTPASRPVSLSLLLSRSSPLRWASTLCPPTTTALHPGAFHQDSAHPPSRFIED